MTRARRTDTNHKPIVAALRKLGWFVFDTSRVGDGFPDLLIAKGSRLLLVEVKDGAQSPSRRQLTDVQRVLHGVLARHGIAVQIVTTVTDAETL